jgi:acyl dehydratase
MIGPFPAALDPEFVGRYAAATRDPFLPARRGEVVPTVALVTEIWEAQEAGREALVDRAILDGMVGGVHGEHEVRLHRPVAAGETLRVFVEGQGTRGSRGKSFVTLKYSMLDDADALVAEQWWTTVFLGVECDDVGDGPPDHTMRESARAHRLGTYTQHVDADMTKAYAEVTDDWSAHPFHVDEVHVSPAILPGSAARFAAPTFLDEDVHVHVYDAGDEGYAFDADCAGATVLAHGRAELF